MSRPIVDIAVVCSDFPASVHFYRDMLGLDIHQELDIPERLAVPSGLAPSSFHHLRLRAGDSLIKLMEINPPPATPAEGFHAGVRWLTFFVDDLNGTIAELSSRGVEFFAPRLEGLAGAFAVAKAPDGVLIEFVELYEAPPQQP